MGVAVLAMTDTNRQKDSKVEIYNWDKKTQGLILSSFFWGYMIMQIPAGLLSKRFGGKLVLMVALLTSGFICGFLPSVIKVGGWKIVCACRMVMGLSQACLYPATQTLLGRWLPSHERTSYTGFVYAGSQIGIVIAMPLSGILAASTMGWKLIFYTISAIMFANALIWHFFAASTPGQHRLMSDREKEYIESGLNTTTSKSFHTPWRRILTTKAFWAVLPAHIGCSIVYILFFVDMPTYLEKGLKISLTNSATLSALPYIGMLIGIIVSSIACEKMFNKGFLRLVTLRRLFNTISITGVTIGLIALSYIGPDSKTLALVMLTVTLTLCGFTNAGYVMSHLDLSPNYAGVMLALTNFVTAMGAVCTPIVTSLILRNDPTDVSRWKIVFLSAAVLSIVTNTLYVIFVSADRQEWDDPHYLDKKDPEEVKPALKINNEDASKVQHEQEKLPQEDN
ncbi:unnamed protein product [Colias eurytheme]|nr:unnamed protein product [Colias eurytheme]